MKRCQMGGLKGKPVLKYLGAVEKFKEVFFKKDGK